MVTAAIHAWFLQLQPGKNNLRGLLSQREVRLYSGPFPLLRFWIHLQHWNSSHWFAGGFRYLEACFLNKTVTSIPRSDCIDSTHPHTIFFFFFLAPNTLYSSRWPWFSDPLASTLPVLVQACHTQFQTSLSENTGSSVHRGDFLTHPLVLTDTVIVLKGVCFYIYVY